LRTIHMLSYTIINLKSVEYRNDSITSTHAMFLFPDVTIVIANIEERLGQIHDVETSLIEVYYNASDPC